MNMTFMFYSYIVYWLPIYNGTHSNVTRHSSELSYHWAHIIKINWFELDEGVVFHTLCSALHAPSINSFVWMFFAADEQKHFPLQIYWRIFCRRMLAIAWFAWISKFSEIGIIWILITQNKHKFVFTLRVTLPQAINTIFKITL